MEYVVVDVETTGFSPGHHHRVIEIAMLRLDDAGVVVDTYETLVNPQRDLGPTHVHGIMGADVAGAPLFEEIAGDVLARLENAVMVAHNASFDARFLQAEMGRCDLPLPTLPKMCTVHLARKAWPQLEKRALGALCQSLEIPYEQAHTAMSDAKATTELFCKARSEMNPSQFAAMLPDVKPKRWPNKTPSGKNCTRQHAPVLDTSPFLIKLVEKLPAPGHHGPEMDAYLSLLDQALLDRIITDQETEALMSLVDELSLDHDQVMNAHRRYVRDLVWYALEDDIITDRESRDLNLVSQLLGIGQAELRGMIANVESGHAPEELMVRENDMAGKSVCFTGTLTCHYNGERMTRDTAEALASEAGLVIAKSVTKTLDFLVVADPNTQSSKARKARANGTPILAEHAFWLKLGVTVH